MGVRAEWDTDGCYIYFHDFFTAKSSEKNVKNCIKVRNGEAMLAFGSS